MNLSFNRDVGVVGSELLNAEWIIRIDARVVHKQVVFVRIVFAEITIAVFVRDNNQD